MKRKIHRKRYSQKEQAKRNRLRVKLVKEYVYDKNVGLYQSFSFKKIRSILKEPDKYIKKQMLNKIQTQND